MQMMNYHKDTKQERIKFELSMLFIVIEESYNKCIVTKTSLMGSSLSLDLFNIEAMRNLKADLEIF